MGLIYGIPKAFIYNGKSSEEFGLSIGYWNTSPEWGNNGLNREILKGETSYVRQRANHYGVSAGEVIQISFDVFPSTCTGDKSDIEMLESHALNRWLLTPTSPQLLSFISDEDSINTNYKAICTSIVDIPGPHGISGKSIIFTCDAGYGYSQVQKTKISVNESKNISINNTSDIGKYYPKIIISKCNGVLEINNFKINLSKIEYETITIDCEHEMIYDQDNSLIPYYKIGLDGSTSLPSLEPGLNKWEIKGTANIVIICEFPRKVGIV